MAANKKITDYTDDELIVNEKKVKTITIMLLAAILLMVVTSAITSSQNGFSALSVMPVCFLPILIVNINNWNTIKKEMKSRNINQK